MNIEKCIKGIRDDRSRYEGNRVRVLVAGHKVWWLFLM